MDIAIREFFTFANELFTLFFVVPAIIGIGLYLTFKMNFVQLSKLKMSFMSLVQDKGAGQGNISHYEAISGVLAGNFGTGNISGMAVALTAGGPGALVWMWLMAFCGSIIQYASCLLGVAYRKKNGENDYVGGPMYYLRDGLGSKKLGAMFAVFALVAALGVGNFAQVNSVTLPLQDLSLDPFYCSIVLAGLVGVVILGGIERFAKVAASVVPVMAVLYLGTALIILGLHYEKVFPAIRLMLTSAIDPASATGGALGFAMTKIITTGFSRGMLATDAGTGIAPIIQSSARTTHPVIDGIVALVPPFLVMIVCTITGLVLMVTDAWKIPGLKSTNMCVYAFQYGLGSNIGSYVVLFSLLMFAYTTVLAWACCGEKAVEYLFGKRFVRKFHYLYIALIPVGAITHVDFVWLIADVGVSFMMVTNLIGVAGLSRQVINQTHEYFGTSQISTSRINEVAVACDAKAD